MDESETKVTASEISLWNYTDESREKALVRDVFMSLASISKFPLHFDIF